ncbi:MAG: sulfotransferase [Proteobacteria bacterium]|nr:sulfotransferase [Pseudomonadota bacterium]
MGGGGGRGTRQEMRERPCDVTIPPSPATAQSRCTDPIFIVGTERSGSNLLRLVLNSHSRLFIPHPPHIMNLMKPFANGYAGRFRELTADVCRLVAWHTFPWEVRLEVDAVLALCDGERDLFAVYAAAHELYRRKSGKARWGCKSTFMINEVERVLRTFPDARIIHLVRDPRDVAVSARSSVFNHFHPWNVAHLWKHEQQKAIRLHETLGPETIMRLRYEDLLADPEAQVRAVCNFLNEAYEPTMLRFFDTPEAKKSASLSADWRNTGSDIKRDNTRKFVTSLTPHEIAIIEGVAELQMAWFDYEPTASPQARLAAARPSRVERLRYAFDEWRWQLRAELRSLRGDRNWPLRLRKWLLLRAYRLKARLRGA